MPEEKRSRLIPRLQSKNDQQGKGKSIYIRKLKLKKKSKYMFLPEDHIVSRALVAPLVEYVAGPWDLNVILCVLTFGFKLHINFFSILGIVGAWYYHKYSY